MSLNFLEKNANSLQNVRMQAAFILSGCLIIKAIYMIAVNYRARSKTKHHCLTFGDVIVASVLDPDLKIKNECMLNSGDGYRHKVEHTCHKHCKNKIPSRTGEDVGHCQRQKCAKFNNVNMAADLVVRTSHFLFRCQYLMLHSASSNKH